MTCICGHHEGAHLSDIGLCAAPEGCNCNHFRKAVPEPTPFVDHAKAKQDAEWLAGSEADTAERNLARAYLAMCDEVAGFTAMWEAREQAHDAEIAKAQADTARLDWWDRIWEDDDINALALAWQSSTPLLLAGSGRAAIDAAMVAMPTTETPE